MNDKKNITAFNVIFAERFSKLVKDIKKIRRDPNQQDRLKKCILEAKELKKVLKINDKKTIQKYTISVPHSIQDVTPNIVCSDNIKIHEVICNDIETIVVFTTN